ncbi:oligopeptide/dipeptide ABC transporter, ATP-binding protein [Aciduliprofundum sp. MAR08-339]|uniref:ABC transporter ATP-binding protein n=1 Tax=Aciduliprofundum sp. (strain MAR08-339) TaxID=673860 RepID=UPI0002A4B75C|nr:oligopeptide/dipeptide ABC transporter, ATP-binding protein [Aciduliprofundum sp. MAR08-339]
MDDDILLKVENLHTYFYTYEGVVKAVDGVSFYVKKGEIFGLVGETGCGKSVTALSIIGLIDEPGKIESGKIIFNGKNLLELPEDEKRKIRGKGISMIFQEPMTALNPVYTIGDQILEIIMLHKYGIENLKKAPKDLKKKERKTVIDMLRLVRMPDPERAIDSYPHELSGGMRQRAMIAMMLATEPSLLIADEPTTALDVTVQAQILNILLDMREKLGISIILITHDLSVVADVCDRVGVMYAGNIVEVGDVYTIFKRPIHPYTRGLMQAIPSIAEKREELHYIRGSVPNLIYPPPGCRFHPRCEYAKDICKREKPQLVEVEPGHFVACHFANQFFANSKEGDGDE